MGKIGCCMGKSGCCVGKSGRSKNQISYDLSQSETTQY